MTICVRNGSRLMAQTTWTHARVRLFGGFVDTAPYFGGEIPRRPENPNFLGVNRRFQAERAKYWKFHVIETTTSISTKFCTTIETIKWSSWVVPMGAQQIQGGGRPPFWKKREIAISLQPFNRFWWNLAWWRTLAPYRGSTVKILFFLFLKIQDGGGRHHEKSQTLRYLRNCLTDLYEIWYGGAKWVSLTAQTVTDWMSKIQDGRQLPFWKPLNHHISATFWPILINFGKMMHVGPQRLA